MTALWSSFLVVALAEMGDKTQLIALTLASRYRKAWTVTPLSLAALDAPAADEVATGAGDSTSRRR